MKKTEEQELLELEQLKKNSPYALPDNAAEAGWTSAQIKEKFYAAIFYIYKLFKEVRSDCDDFEEDIDERMSSLETTFNQFLDEPFAKKDIENNDIIATYAKKADLTSGILPVLKYITANGESADIRQIAADFSSFATLINGRFTGNSANTAIFSTKARYDESGHQFETYYATISSFNNLQATVSALINGTTAVGKALNDYQGNAIHTTYVKIADISNVLGDTSTIKPLSAYQGKVLKEYIDAINLLLDSDDTDLDTIQEIVTYVKNNKSIIDSITTSKVSVTDIVDNLTSQLSNKPLSANQGYVLKTAIDSKADALIFANNNDIINIMED